MSAEKKQKIDSGAARYTLAITIAKVFRVLREKRNVVPGVAAEIFDYLGPLKYLLWLRFPIIRSCTPRIRSAKQITHLNFDRACVAAAESDIEMLRWAMGTQPLISPEMAYYAEAINRGVSIVSHIAPLPRFQQRTVERLQRAAARHGNMEFLRWLIGLYPKVRPPSPHLLTGVGIDDLMAYRELLQDSEDDQFFMIGYCLRTMQDVYIVIQKIAEKKDARDVFNNHINLVQVFSGAVTAATLRHDMATVGLLQILASTMGLSVDHDNFGINLYLDHDSAGSIRSLDLRSMLAETEMSLSLLKNGTASAKALAETRAASDVKECFLYEEEQALEVLKLRARLYFERLKCKDAQRTRDLDDEFDEAMGAAPALPALPVLPAAPALPVALAPPAAGFWAPFGAPGAGGILPAPLGFGMPVPAPPRAPPSISERMRTYMLEIRKQALKYGYYRVLQWLHSLNDEKSDLKSNVVPALFEFDIIWELVQKPRLAPILIEFARISPEEAAKLIPPRRLSVLWTVALGSGNVAALELLQRLDAKTAEISFPRKFVPASHLKQVQEEIDYEGACAYIIKTGLISRFRFYIAPSSKKDWMRTDRSYWHLVLVARLSPSELSALLLERAL